MSSRNTDVAIIGMSCIFPGAPNVQAYWQNIVSKVDAISDPPEGWGTDEIFDPESTANDRIYCKRGGYLGDLARFSALDYGVMPRTVDGSEPEHFLALRVAYEALADAGYAERAFNRDRTAVIVGRGTFLNRGSVTSLQHGLIVDQTVQILKQLHPEYSEGELQTIRGELKATLPPFNAETAPGLVPNVMCGRIANRLDLRGPNYTVDAACASSLVAVDLAMRELVSGRCDLALAGGVNVSTPPTVLMVFCQLGALSRRGQIRPFDKEADGVLLGEGLGMIILKRREDAERDGDRIYALIKGVGIASDGRGLAVLAPRLEGEELALQRAYDTTGISPRSIELIEAHGTGTSVGDLTEVQAMSRVFGSQAPTGPWCAFGSVKSMISHTIPAAGIASLIKTALALHHKILPPTIGCSEPNPKFELEKSPFYINTDSRPWIHGAPEPRRAGVNAFGFGGINTHAILEEYIGPQTVDVPNFLHRWDSEVFIIQADSRQGLIRAMQDLSKFLSGETEVPLRDVAYTLNCPLQESGYRIAIVANSLEDLQKKLAYGLERLAHCDCTKIKDRSGIFFFEQQLSKEGGLAFLFPGEGSQYVNMLGDLCLHFPEVRIGFDRADRVFRDKGGGLLLSQVLFPRPLQSSTSESSDDLWRMDFAVAGVLEADQALFRLLSHLGIRPNAVVGHSSGEYAALLASGGLAADDEEQLVQHAFELNRLYSSLERQIPAATLMTVGGANPTLLASVLAESESDLYVTMDNCPHQVILCGNESAVTCARDRLQKQGAFCTLLPFQRAYHTPLFQPVCDQLAHFFRRLDLKIPHTILYSCVTAQQCPPNPEKIRQLMIEQWARPVRFRETIESMYGAGVRTFVEVGPRGNLTGFIDDILKNRRFLAVPSNVPHRSGISQLNTMIGLLAAHGVSMQLDCLYKRRSPKRLSFERQAEAVAKPSGEASSMRLALELPRLTLAENRRSRLSDLPRSSPSQFSGPNNLGDHRAESHASQEANVPAATALLQRSLNGGESEFIYSSPALSPASQTCEDVAFADREDPRQVMEQYLQTMERFLNTQQKIMTGFMDLKGVGNTVGERARSEQTLLQATVDPLRLPSESARIGPFNLAISSLTPGVEVIATCELDLEEHLFLRHHTIGGSPSALDAKLTALPIVPLSISLEMMAQTAALLLPEMRLLALKNVRAHQWIVVEERHRALTIVAKCKDSERVGEVEVKISEDTESKAAESDNLLIAEGTLVFGDGYPAPPPPDQIPLRSQRPYRFAPKEFYKEVMFHGPSFQSVTSIDQCGENGLDATVRVPPGIQLFRSNPSPELHTDPVLLDSAGQAVGFWTVDRLETGAVIFPLGFQDLHIYGPWPREGELVKCQTRSTALSDGWIRSNIDLVGAGNRLLVRFVGWEDMRIDLPRPFCRFVLSPRDVLMSTPWAPPISSFPPSSRSRCCRLDGLPAPIFEKGPLAGAWTRMILSGEEHEFWLKLAVPEKRRREWLVGRLAAKDAVRLFLKDYCDVSLCPADIPIDTNEHGQPTVEAGPIEKLGCRLCLSIAHSGGCAVAVAGEFAGHLGVGIDIEVIGRSREGFEKGSLSPEEQALLEGVPSIIREEWLLRFWCAKEAVAKALGRGMAGTPLNLVIQELERETGKVNVMVARELTRQLPAYAGILLPAFTGRDDKLIFASSMVKLITPN